MSTRLGLLSIVCIQLGLQKLFIIQSIAGCTLCRGSLIIEVNGMEGELGHSLYSLSRVPLYVHNWQQYMYMYKKNANEVQTYKGELSTWSMVITSTSESKQSNSITLIRSDFIIG